MAYKEFREKIVKLKLDVDIFHVEFLDRDGFKRFADNLRHNVESWTKICITGYFSETIRKSLESIIEAPAYNIKLICPYLNTKKPRDRKNLQALGKLAKAGAEIKVNDRLHARLLVAYDVTHDEAKKYPYLNYRGLLIVGSFDFNTECIGLERYDAGIKTRHPDLVRSAVELFEQIWNEAESIPLEEFIKKGKD